jgi:hypothetical protein
MRCSVIASIAQRRLQHQSITGAPRRNAAEVVAWHGAVQAQEYPAAKWGLALRMAESTTDAAIERAFNAGRILRTHVMRPTWHFVTARDIRWMLELTGGRVQRTMQPYNRHLELDAATLNRALTVIERALGDGEYLTRLEVAEHLARGGIEAKGQRLAHVALHAELEAVICSGPRRGQHFTYSLLAARAPRARRLQRDEAIAELTLRYFRSHGPATVRDFVWWSGLLTAEAKRGLDMIRARPAVVDGLTYWSTGGSPAQRAGRRRVHLLPVYDEYLVAFRDRKAVPHWQAGMDPPAAFPHPLVIDGQVAGTWRPVRFVERVRVDVSPVRTLTSSERHALDGAVARYSRFLGTRVDASLASSPTNSSS